MVQMNIIIIIGSPVLGGLERVAFNLSKWFCTQPGCHSTVIALSGTDYNAFDTTGYDYIELSEGQTIRKLRKAIKYKHPDIVLTMSVPSCIYTVPALLGLGIKHVVSERNDPNHFAGRTITRIVSRCLLRFADAYVFQTRQAQAYYGGNIAKNSVVIHNPLYKLFDISNLSLNSHRREIVSVGRLNPQKNFPMLIEAFSMIQKSFPLYRLIIYGEGPRRTELEGLIKSLGLENSVFLPGSTIDVLDKIKDATLFVLSSDFEGMPNALMEAMSLGLPCISTKCPCGGPEELIHDNHNGILVPVGDKKALSEAMIDLLNNDEKRNRLGNAAKKIRESHSMDKICHQWYDYFMGLIIQ